MKKRILLNNLFIFFISVLILLGYLFLFLFPGLVGINRSRREINDIRLKISDYTHTQQMMIFPDQREREMLKQARRKFLKFVPVWESNRKGTAFLEEVGDFIRSSAKAGGIQKFFFQSVDPATVSFSSKPGLTAMEKRMLNGFRETGQKNEVVQSSPRGTRGFHGFINSQMISKNIIMGFSGEIKQATSFLYGLSRSNFTMRIEKIKISAGNEIPFFLVSLSCFFWDEKKEMDYTGTRDNFIDFNSPLLLVPIYNTPVFGKQNRKLPEYSGQKIFVFNRR